jgi:hypothetical protein
MERLAWVAAVFLFAWLARRWLRARQTRRLRMRATSGAQQQAILVVVVSPRCAICPAQKNVVDTLRERYPPSLLRVTTVDAAVQTAQARELGVMTVPTTLVQGPDGSTFHVNHGFARLDVLARQIDDLLAPPHPSPFI